MNKEEFIGKLQMVYVGDRNAFNEIVSVYDDLQQRIDKESKTYKPGKFSIERYDEAIKEINKLESNWKALKEWLEEQIPTDKTVCTKRLKIFDVLDKMNSLEGDK